MKNIANGDVRPAKLDDEPEDSWNELDPERRIEYLHRSHVELIRQSSEATAALKERMSKIESDLSHASESILQVQQLVGNQSKAIAEQFREVKKGMDAIRDSVGVEAEAFGVLAKELAEIHRKIDEERSIRTKQDSIHDDKFVSVEQKVEKAETLAQRLAAQITWVNVGKGVFLAVVLKVLEFLFAHAESVPKLLGKLGMSARYSLQGDSLGLNQRGIPGGPHCLPKKPPELTHQQRRSTLREAAESIRKIYIERGADKVKYTKIQVEDWVRDKPRHFAACRTDGKMIVLASELALQTPKVMGAIIAHEFGHATDFCYPGSFLIQPSGELIVRPQGLRSNQSLPREVMRYWEERSSDQIERTADKIAEKIMGIRIGYCGPCNLQTMLVGSPDEAGCKYPRPRGLR